MLLSTYNYPVILIPTYRPDSSLTNLITSIRQRSSWPIVVVDDGNQSTKYQQLLNELLDIPFVYLVRHPFNKGKGAALKTGIAYIQRYFPKTVGCVTADADGQHAVEDILNIGNHLALHSHHLILGARQFSNKNVPFRSAFGNKITAWLFKFSTGIRCDDTQTGLRGIPQQEFSTALSISGDRFEYEMNYLLSAAQRHVPILNIPITTIYIDNNASSHYNPLNDSLKILWSIAKFSLSSSIGVIIDLSCFFILIQLFSTHTTLTIFLATFIARLLSGSVNYLLNLKFTFHSQHSIHTFLKYFALFMFLILASTISVSILPPLFGNIVYTKIVVDSLLFFTSFLIQQRFIFNHSLSF